MRIQVGVDLNRVAVNTWQAAPLQFVAGLGPRKAQALLRAVQRVQSVESRFALWEELGLLGRNVFRSACHAKRFHCLARMLQEGCSNQEYIPL